MTDRKVPRDPPVAPVQKGTAPQVKTFHPLLDTPEIRDLVAAATKEGSDHE